MKSAKHYLNIISLFTLVLCFSLGASDQKAVKKQAFGQALYDRACLIVNESENNTTVAHLVKKMIADEDTYLLLNLGKREGFAAADILNSARSVAQEHEDPEVDKVLEEVVVEVSKSWFSKHPIMLLAMAGGAIIAYIKKDMVMDFFSSILNTLGFKEESKKPNGDADADEAKRLAEEKRLADEKAKKDAEEQVRKEEAARLEAEKKAQEEADDFDDVPDLVPADNGQQGTEQNEDSDDSCPELVPINGAANQSGEAANNAQLKNQKECDDVPELVLVNNDDANKTEDTQEVKPEVIQENVQSDVKPEGASTNNEQSTEQKTSEVTQSEGTQEVKSDWKETAERVWPKAQHKADFEAFTQKRAEERAQEEAEAQRLADEKAQQEQIEKQELEKIEAEWRSVILVNQKVRNKAFEKKRAEQKANNEAAAKLKAQQNAQATENVEPEAQTSSDMVTDVTDEQIEKANTALDLLGQETSSESDDKNEQGSVDNTQQPGNTEVAETVTIDSVVQGDQQESEVKEAQSEEEQFGAALYIKKDKSEWQPTNPHSMFWSM